MPSKWNDNTCLEYGFAFWKLVEFAVRFVDFAQCHNVCNLFNASEIGNNVNKIKSG